MTAREEAAAYIQAVRDYWYPTPVPAGAELDAIPSELLHRVADERPMTNVTTPGPVHTEWHEDGTATVTVTRKNQPTNKETQ